MADHLPYQPQPQADTELSRARWRRWLGISRTDAWSSLAHELGAKFVERRWLTGETVILTTGHNGSWRIVMDLLVVSTGNVTIQYTRIRVPFLNPSGFRFSVRKSNLFTPLAAWMGFEDVLIGVPDFDDRFVIKSHQPSTAQRLFADPILRQLLLNEPDTAVSVLDHSGYFGPNFPPQTDLLECMVLGDIRDLDRLHRLFGICRVALNQLSDIGIALPGDPGVEI